METSDGDPCPEEVGMSISINGNSSSLFAQKSLLGTENATQKTLSHLSSGKKINNACENAANLAIAVQMAAQLGSSNQDVSNAGDALDVANTADAALDNTTDILSRLDELAMESGDGALNASDRGDIQDEADALTAQLNSIAGGTEFNGTPLLNGNANLTFQVGTGNVPGNDRLTLNTGDASAAALGVSGLDLSHAIVGGERARQHRLGDPRGVVAAVHAGRAGEPRGIGGVASPANVAEPGRRAQQHHGRRHRVGGVGSQQRDDPGTGGRRRARAGQPEPARPRCACCPAASPTRRAAWASGRLRRQRPRCRPSSAM